MRKYIIKFVIIVSLVFLNLIVRFDNSTPDYTGTEIKKKFSYLSNDRSPIVKEAKKIHINKALDLSKSDTKEEIIDKLVSSKKSVELINVDAEKENNTLFEMLNNEDTDNALSLDNALILDDISFNKTLLDWDAEDSIIYYTDEDKTIFLKESSKSMILKPRKDMVINNNFMHIDFDGSNDAYLHLVYHGEKVTLNINNAMGIKYFYIDDIYMGSKIESLEFVKNNDYDFYLSIGEILYE